MTPILVVPFLAILLSSSAARQDSSCTTIVTSSRTAIALLDEQKQMRESPCIVSAIRQLGESRATNGVSVLIGYLDFVDPATKHPPGGPAFVRPDYPAVAALFQIGRPAAQELLSAIQLTASPTIRENAQKTYLFVYRDDLASGIRQIKQAERAASSVEARRKLQVTMQMLMDACNGRPEHDAQLCKDAASKG